MALVAGLDRPYSTQLRLVLYDYLDPAPRAIIIIEIRTITNTYRARVIRGVVVGRDLLEISHHCNNASTNHPYVWALLSHDTIPCIDAQVNYKLCFPLKKVLSWLVLLCLLCTCLAPLDSC